MAFSNRLTDACPVSGELVQQQNVYSISNFPTSCAIHKQKAFIPWTNAVRDRTYPACIFLRPDSIRALHTHTHRSFVISVSQNLKI